MGRRKRLARLRVATQFGLVLLSLLLLITSATAQLQSTRVELSTQTFSDEALFHVRVQRGQTIESADLTQGDNNLVLETEPVPLQSTQWIVVDASEEMVNLQSAVLQAIQRFLRNDTNQNGLITFNSRVNVLRPTDRVSQIDNFLADYTATAGEPACIEQALQQINEVERDLDRTWRILVITAADFSQDSECPDTDMPILAAPVDIVAVTDDIPQRLSDLVNTSGGDILTANLRTVEARVNEVRTAWGQPSFALRAPLSEEWDTDSEMQLLVTLSNGVEESHTVTFREYNVPPPPEPTAAPTEVVLETIPTRASEPTEVVSEAVVEPTQVPNIEDVPEADSSGSADVAFLLIIGAVLFIVGAVVLALAMSRVRRAPYAQATASPSQNFYDALDDEDEGVVATKIRERSIVEDNDVGVTQVSDNIVPPIDADEPDTRTFTQEEAEDDLLITQVLTDERFQSMMRKDSELTIIAFLRLEGMVEGDFALYEKGALIGRSQDCDIQITGDRAISRQHAQLAVQNDGTVTISRLSATNPVVVGGINVANRHPLKPNDVIHLTDMTRLIFITNTDTEFDEEATIV